MRKEASHTTHRVRLTALCVVAAAAAIMMFGVGTTAAQSNELKISRGEVVENIPSGSDSTQHYALYLPSSYDPDLAMPVMLLMDPRGRATVPMDLFVRGAEEFGYVLLSSYRTLSDDPTAFTQNDAALNAMVVDAQARFATDPNRIYLVGFSGTAHYAWTISSQLDGSLAGIVGVGGGLPAYSKPIQMGMAMDRPLAFYGIAGIGDFNYDGVRWLDEALDTTRVAHRFVRHDGRHQWPEEPLAYEAVRWFQLQAMRSGWIPVDEGFLDDLHDDYMDEAERLEKDDDFVSAFRRYREIAADFEDFNMGREARKRFERASNDPDVLEEMVRWDEYAREVQLYKLRVRDFREAYRAADPPMDHEEAVQGLLIEKLLKQSEDRDYEKAGAAKRMLASAHATTSFYEPRDYLTEGDYERAAAVLLIAVEIYGWLPRTCYMMARARAQLGDVDGSLEALGCAEGAPWFTDSILASDPLLEPIRDTAGFRELVGNQSGS